MLELILEIVGFLITSALIGIFLGYLVWGWRQRERIETARADGAARARTSVDGDPALEGKVRLLTEERDKLKKSLSDLQSEVETLRTAAPEDGLPDKSDAPPGSPDEREPIDRLTQAFSKSSEDDGAETEEEKPSEHDEEERTEKPSSVFRRSTPKQDDKQDTEEIAYGALRRQREAMGAAGGGLAAAALHGEAEAPSEDVTQDAQDDSPEADDHTVPAFFGSRPRPQTNSDRDADMDAEKEREAIAAELGFDPENADEVEFLDADIEIVDDPSDEMTDDPALKDPALNDPGQEEQASGETSETPTEDEDETPATDDEIDAAIKDILKSVQGDDAPPPMRTTRLFGRSKKDDADAKIDDDATDAEIVSTETPPDAAEDAPRESKSADMPIGFFTVPPEEIDDLKLIRGVGFKMEALLNKNGVYQYRQIARFSPDDIEWLTEAIQSFPGRIERDDWIGQATALNREKYGDEII